MGNGEGCGAVLVCLRVGYYVHEHAVETMPKWSGHRGRTWVAGEGQEEQVLEEDGRGRSGPERIRRALGR